MKYILLYIHVYQQKKGICIHLNGRNRSENKCMEINWNKYWDQKNLNVWLYFTNIELTNSISRKGTKANQFYQYIFQYFRKLKLIMISNH